MANAKVQTAGGSVAGGLAVTRSFPMHVTSGNLLTAFVHSADATATLTVTDSQGSYVQAGSYTTGTGGAVSWWYRTATATGGNVVQALSNLNTNMAIQVGEWSSSYGLSFNSSTGGTGTSAAPSTGSITATSGDLVLAGWGRVSNSGSLNNITGSPFTAISGTGVAGTGAQQAYDLTATGSVTGTFDSTSSVAWCARGVSFTPAAAPVVVPPVNIYVPNRPGPPMLGFPWSAPIPPTLRPLGVTPPVPPPPVTPPVPPPPPPNVPPPPGPLPPVPPVPPGSSLSSVVFQFDVDKDIDPRARRIFEELASKFNPLFARGYIVVNPDGSTSVVVATDGLTGTFP